MQLNGGGSRMSAKELLQVNCIGCLTTIDNPNSAAANSSPKQFCNLSILYSELERIIGQIITSFQILSNQRVRKVSIGYAIGL
jgi:hypothetical protein